MFISSQGLFLSCLMLCQQGSIQKNKLGGNTVGTGDPNWPKGFSTLQNIMPSIGGVTRGSYPNGGQSGFGKGGLVSVSRWWKLALCITCFLPFDYHCYYYLQLLLYFTLISIIKLFFININILLWFFSSCHWGMHPSVSSRSPWLLCHTAAHFSVPNQWVYQDRQLFSSAWSHSLGERLYLCFNMVKSHYTDDWLLFFCCCSLLWIILQLWVSLCT